MDEELSNRNSKAIKENFWLKYNLSLHVFSHASRLYVKQCIGIPAAQLFSNFVRMQSLNNDTLSIFVKFSEILFFVV